MTSDQELWQRTKLAFDQLADMAPGERAALLQQIGQTDPALLEQVERLLSIDGDAEAALSRYDFAAPAALTDTTSPDPLGIVGGAVSHYDITGYLAAGGMGVVYAAHDHRLNRDVALKFPLPHQQLEQSVKERFANEARSAAAIDHPAICPIFEIGESEHGVFLAMPLYGGETLRQLISREGALAPPQALEIVRQMTAGLVALHQAGVTHRDLKPGNVMLLPGGTVKLLDFGLAKIRDVDLTRSRLVLGTIGYVAPEQLRGERPDFRVDLWAVGVILHEMLTGQPPFARDHELSVLHAILHEHPAMPSSSGPDIPVAFDELIGVLLQKKPADRFQSAEELLADLDRMQHGLPIVQRVPFWSRTPLRRSARRGALPAAGVLVILLLTALWWDRQDAGPEWTDGVAEIGSVAELMAALDPVNAGRVVRLRSGEYLIDRPLAVPDGMTLEGVGVMQFDVDGRPTGFTDQSRTTLRMTANVGGDLLAMGNGASLRNLEIVDLPGRSGNIVAVVSRGAGDSVSATITESIIVNPNPLAIGPGGALGRGLYVVSLNPNMAADPAAHEGTVLTVKASRSIIRSPAGGGGLFAYNFAADSRITLELSDNVIGGSSEANGGVSRPDAVHDSEVRIESVGNLFRNDWADPCVSPLLGWNLTGGSGAPIPIPLPATTGNRLVVNSLNDRLDGFTTAVVATGSRRFFAQPLNAAPSDNSIELLMDGTVITTPVCGEVGQSGNTAGIARARSQEGANLRLAGAWVENDRLEAGDRNTVRAEFRNVTGSGTTANEYGHTRGVSGALPVRLRGSGNRLLVVGDPGTFDRLNRGIDPRPPAGFFVGGTGSRSQGGP